MKHLLLSAALFSVWVSLAQLSLSASEITPSHGDKIEMFDIVYFTPGGSGVDQIWDYSHVTINLTNIQTLVFEPNTGNPGVDFVYVTSPTLGQSDSIASYVSLYSNELLINATVDPTSIVTYSDPQLAMFFPLTLTATQTDSFAATVSQQNMTLDRVGTTTITVDGRGQLFAPLGFYSNAFRVHTHTEIEDSYMGQVHSTTTIDIYDWYASGTGNFVLRFKEETTQGQTTQTGVVFYKQSSILGTENLNNSSVLTLSPNPFSTELRVSNLNSEVEKIEVYDLTGKVVKTMTVENETDVVIATEDLQEGMYILKAYGREGEVLDTQKVVKQ